jgi:hypothetical protein
VPNEHPRVAGRGDDSGGDEVECLEPKRLAAYDPHHAGNLRDADRHRRVAEARSADRGKPDGEDEERKRQHQIGDPRDHGVEQGGVAGRESERHTGRERDRHREHARLQRRAHAEQDPRQQVAAEVVGAEDVPRRTRR